jgi:GntR family transcriptional repressor for pyruvate dehydrogenase complex
MKRSIHRSTLVNDVVHELREMILAGEVQPGELLPPRKDLAVQFGVGLSTISEAIQVLSAVGLLASRPGKGTWMRHDALDSFISPAAVKARLGELNARQVCEARSVIEVALTELAAQRATPEDIKRIRDALNAMEATVNGSAAFVEADWEFHLAVARAGRNELLEQFYHLSRRLLLEVISEMLKIPNVEQDAIPLQRAIAQAIERHDLRSARKAALAHMEYLGLLLDMQEKQD